jgi:hypothetical protein
MYTWQRLTWVEDKVGWSFTRYSFYKVSGLQTLPVSEVAMGRANGMLSFRFLCC